jgi:hypothetical protein
MNNRRLTPTQAKLDQAAARRSAFTDARLRATLARTAAAFKRPAFPTPADPQGLYRILDVPLRPALLDPNQQRTIDDEVKSAYYMASKIYHPDAPTVSRGGMDEGDYALEERVSEGEMIDMEKRDRKFRLMFQKANDARNQLGSRRLLDHVNEQELMLTSQWRGVRCTTRNIARSGDGMAKWDIK